MVNLEDKLIHDSETMLVNGRPSNPHNDYQRHLWARHMKLQGFTRQEVSDILAGSNLADVEVNKRGRYIEDILNSIIVGFGGNLPVYAAVYK